MSRPNIALDIDRLFARLDQLVAINPLPPDGACRLALTDEDRAGRALFNTWAADAGLTFTTDAVGNQFATLPGNTTGAPVMSGSHLDTVATGGRFDGALGVVAALAVVEAVQQAGLALARGLIVANFTNEEGARFAPDMLGSLVYAGGMSVAEAHAVQGVDGALFGDELRRIGAAGDMTPGAIQPHAFVELHVEQGPVLNAEGLAIGVVEGVQGISWHEVTFAGEANHAGATPMQMRRDAGFAASSLATRCRALTQTHTGLRATCGRMVLEPNLINVIAERAVITVDLRHPDEATLTAAEADLARAVEEAAEAAGVSASRVSLARFAPVPFDRGVAARIEAAAATRGLRRTRLISGAGHDAQMIARIAPSGMMFAPSIGGISHNPREATRREDIEGAVNVLADVLVSLAMEE
ncbi:MAG: hydantoinase/carbamoylase family amidase [Pseudomonadota bacterium]